MNKKFAFTLAEVLITLTIIGVIAAITIPNLMQNYIKHERIVQIKEAKSILANAIKMSILENGSPDEWSYADKTELAEKYIFPYLKIKKDYKVYDNGTIADLNGNRIGGGYFESAAMENGMIVAVSTGTIAGNTKIAQILVDVNGKKGRTQLGSDIFVFRLYLDVNVKGIRPGLFVTEPGGNNIEPEPSVYLETITNGGCNTASLNAVNPGYGCAKILEINNWEFPEDYPIKKF